LPSKTSFVGGVKQGRRRISIVIGQKYLFSISQQVVFRNYTRLWIGEIPLVAVY
jgi:hypothetical protein